MTTPDALPPYRLVRGTRPLLVSTPHVGTRTPEMLAPAVAVAQASSYSWVSNGRFKGGYITRH